MFIKYSIMSKLNCFIKRSLILLIVLSSNYVYIHALTQDDGYKTLKFGSSTNEIMNFIINNYTNYEISSYHSSDDSNYVNISIKTNISFKSSKIVFTKITFCAFKNQFYSVTFEPILDDGIDESINISILNKLSKDYGDKYIESKGEYKYKYSLSAYLPGYYSITMKRSWITKNSLINYYYINNNDGLDDKNMYFKYIFKLEIISKTIQKTIDDYVISNADNTQTY